MESSRDERIGKSWRRYFRTDVRTLVVLVACCGVVLWAVRLLWESQHPAIALARGLKTPKASERISLVRNLERVDYQDSSLAIPPLLARLGDGNAQVRAATARALGSLGGAVTMGSSAIEARNVVKSLLASLGDRETAVRIEAANALAMIVWSDSAGMMDLKPVHAALMELLDTEVPEVRGAAIRAIGLVGPKISADPPAVLIGAMEDDSAQNRSDAIDALTSFTRGLHRSLPSLFRSMEGAGPEIHKSYMQLLDRIRPPKFPAEAVPAFIVALGSHDREVRLLAIRRLADFKQNAQDAVPALISLLREPIESDPASARAVAEGLLSREPALAATNALGQIAPGTNVAGPAVLALTEAMRSNVSEERILAIMSLAEFGPEAAAAIPALITALRETAATEKPVTVFIPANVWNDSHLTGRWIAHALGRIAPGTASADEVVTVLADALSSRSIHTRTEAIAALGGLGPKAAVAIPQLRALLNDPNADTRDAANAALLRLEN